MKNIGKKEHRRIGSFTTRYIFERDEGMCIYCGNPAQELDHVIPTKDGGRSIKNNLVCACRRCNMKKARHPNDSIWLTRAIFWLLEKGEDVSWMDDFYK